MANLGEAIGVLIGVITIGSVYALSGVGFVVLFRSTSVLSFTQGEFMAAGAVVFYLGTATWHIGSLASAATSLVVVAVSGWLVYRVLFRRLAGAEPFIVAVATIALGTVLQMIEYLIIGPDSLPMTTNFQNVVVARISGQGILGADVTAVLAAVILVGALILWLTRTGTGLKMRALGENASLASYYGVDIDRLSGVAWALGALLAGAAGIAYALLTTVDVQGIPNVGLVVFPGVLLGGLDSVAGALVGSYLIAGLEAVVSLTVGGTWENAVAYGVMLVVLLTRPSGFFGTKHVVRL